MQIGLIGLPNSGKTTVFNALTCAEAPVTAYASVNAEANLAVVQVGDERLLKLSDHYDPQKTTPAIIELVDIPGLRGERDGADLFPPATMQRLRELDAFAVVVRNFASAMGDAPTPATDLAAVNEELVFADLVTAEKRLEKVAWSKHRNKMTPQLGLEEKIFNRTKEALEGGTPYRDIELSPDEEAAVKGYGLLSRKPIMIILNSGESEFGSSAKIVSELTETAPTVEFAGSFEMDLAAMDDEEAAPFLEDMGISESARDRLTRLAYETLGRISFFTVGSDEVRAWTLRRGDTALDAAGAIHSDLRRGFIRAECFTCDQLMEHGSEKALKEKGLFRLEGKEYVVRDGDILSIRFSV